jgi:NADH-quinone oxidoreductase subunit M
MKFLLPLSTFSTQYFFPLAISLFLISVYYCSFLSLIELDIKRIIAYSSIVHMNGALLGLFSGTIYGIQGFILIMVAHGLVSAALFILIGQLYERHHSKSILFYGGLASIMPKFAFFLSIFIFANFSCPGSLNFVGELLVYFGIFLLSKKIAFLYILSALVSTAYSIYFLTRICFGSLKTLYITSFQDLSKREIFISL